MFILCKHGYFKCKSLGALIESRTVRVQVVSQAQHHMCSCFPSILWGGLCAFHQFSLLNNFQVHLRRVFFSKWYVSCIWVTMGLSAVCHPTITISTICITWLLDIHKTVLMGCLWSRKGWSSVNQDSLRRSWVTRLPITCPFVLCLFAQG